MKRARILIGLIVLLALAAAGVQYLVWAVSRVPDFYAAVQQEIENPSRRREDAAVLVRRTQRLVEETQQAEQWAEEFTQQQVNSWLAEELPAQHPDWIPSEISDPRISFSPDLIRVGFRYQNADWESVVHLELSPHVEQPGRLAIECRAVHAGLLPLPWQKVLSNVSDWLTKRGWPSEWKDIDGRDVLIIDFSRDPTAVSRLENVEITEGRLGVSGKGRPEAPVVAEPRR